MFRKVVSIFLFLLIFSCRGKIQAVNVVPFKDTAIKILIWGLPDQDDQRAMEAAAKSFGFEYHRIAGCIISKNLADSADKVNERSSEILRARFGKNWKIQVEKKIHLIKDSISKARLSHDSSKVEVIGIDGKPVDYSKDQIPPPFDSAEAYQE
jgi:hypothetical protein